MKIIFFGSSDFSLLPLEFCLTSRHDLAAVVTTPNRPQGRGLRIQANPVKTRSEKAGARVLTPASLRDSQIEASIASLEPDVFVVASYGKLIPTSWLRIPRKAALNFHPSLLPKYRGAAPIPRQILDGERETGLSVAEVTPELDAGDIFYQKRIPLEERATTRSLTLDLTRLAAEALEIVLEKLAAGRLEGTPQNPAKATYAQKLTKEEGSLNLSDPADILFRKVRAYDPWPGAVVKFQSHPLRILEAEGDPSASSLSGNPGTFLGVDDSGALRIQTGRGVLKAFKVQLPGRQPVTGKDFANGQRIEAGFLFENLR